MLKLNSYPKNKDKMIRLIDFFKEILDVCETINVDPILDGGLAVFLYTENTDMVVNDIDLSYSEKAFPKIASAVIKHGMNAEIKKWHVLQVRKDDLKVEFGDTDFWYPNVPIDYQDYFQVGDHKVKVLKIDSLISFYEVGLKNLENDNEKQQKYKDLKTKYESLKAVKKHLTS